MIEYYGKPGTGKPFPPENTYFAWDTVAQKGWWVNTRGRQVAWSHFTMDMSLPREWTRVHDCTADEVYLMDVGL